MEGRERAYKVLYQPCSNRGYHHNRAGGCTGVGAEIAKRSIQRGCKMCEKCEYVCDTPLGSYCTLTNEAIETTTCHYDEQKEMEYEIMKRVSR